MIYYKNYDLTKHNSFGIKSIAKEIWFPKTQTEFMELLYLLKGNRFFILSGGTNVLLAKSISKVISLRKFEKIFKIDEDKHIQVSASYSTGMFVKHILDLNITGVEGLIGIPGLIGGAITMNAGSGKYTISDYLTNILTIDYNGVFHYRKKESLNFQRRDSLLQKIDEIVLKAYFKFEKNGINNDKILEIKKYRRDFPKGYSAGGIFINHYDLIPYEKQIRQLKLNNLTVSKYLNVLINNGNATDNDVFDAIDMINNIVKVPLQLEIKPLGFYKNI